MKSRDDIIEFMNTFAKFIGYKVYIVDLEDCFGEVDLINRIIYLDYKHTSIRKILSTFFHEVGHVFDLEAGVYKHFYSNKTKSVKYIYAAECHTDKTGEWLMALYFPHLKYEAWYLENKKEAIDFLEVYYSL